MRNRIAASIASKFSNRNAKNPRFSQGRSLHAEALEDRRLLTIGDLTTTGAHATINGTIFAQFTDNSAAGTGLIDSFLRVQNTGAESGYNTDNKTTEFDTKDGRALP